MLYSEYLKAASKVGIDDVPSRELGYYMFLILGERWFQGANLNQIIKGIDEIGVEAVRRGDVEQLRLQLCLDRYGRDELLAYLEKKVVPKLLSSGHIFQQGGNYYLSCRANDLFFSNCLRSD